VATRYLVCFITRSDRLNHDRRIRRIGGFNRDGTRWQINEEQAIAAIEAGRWSFYVEVEHRELPLIVTLSKYGVKYLKTPADGLHPERLLALPESP
jgi:hypothetical protein